MDEDPDTCPGCQRRYQPNRVLVSFLRCWDCPPPDRIGGGHTTWLCRHCGWLNVPGHTPDGWRETLSDTLRVHDRPDPAA